MDIKKNYFSIVIAGSAHNPSILNPDFLINNNIVPKDWELLPSPITTPPFAAVSYANGITINVDPTKLQIIDLGTNEPPSSNAPEVARKYVKALPHVPYKAVGINFQSFITVASPEEFLGKKFLKAGRWSGVLSPAGAKFTQPINEGRLALSLEAGEAQKASAIIINANFHREASGNGILAEKVAEFISEAPNDYKKYINILRNILETEGGKV